MRGAGRLAGWANATVGNSAVITETVVLDGARNATCAMIRYLWRTERNVRNDPLPMAHGTQRAQ